MTIQQLQTFNPVTTPEGSLDTRLSGPCGTLHLLNESLESMLFARDADFSTILGIVPALWAQNIVIQRPPASIWYKVISTLPADDTTLQSVQGLSYSQGEDTSSLYTGPLPRIANVGNPSSVNTSGNTLFNTGNAPGLEVIKIGSTANAGLTADVTNDGLWTLSVTIAGILHQFLKTQASSPQLMLGQLNDLVQFLGNLEVNGAMAVGASPAANTNFLSWSTADTEVPIVAKANSATQSANLIQALSSAGAALFEVDHLGTLIQHAEIHMPNQTWVSFANTSGGRQSVLQSDGSNNFQIADPGGGRVYFTNASGGQYGYFTGDGIHVSIGRFWGRNSNGWGTMGGSNATSCGSATVISHGLGENMTMMACNTVIAQAGSATVGVGNFTSTTFTATITAGTGITWIAFGA